MFARVFVSLLAFVFFVFLRPRVPKTILHTKPPKKLTILVLGGVFKGLLGTPPPSLLSANAGFMVPLLTALGHNMAPKMTPEIAPTRSLSPWEIQGVPHLGDALKDFFVISVQLFWTTF